MHSRIPPSFDKSRTVTFPKPYFFPDNCINYLIIAEKKKCAIHQTPKPPKNVPLNITNQHKLDMMNGGASTTFLTEKSKTLNPPALPNGVFCPK